MNLLTGFNSGTQGGCGFRHRGSADYNFVPSRRPSGFEEGGPGMDFEPPTPTFSKRGVRKPRSVHPEFSQAFVVHASTPGVFRPEDVVIPGIAWPSAG